MCCFSVKLTTVKSFKIDLFMSTRYSQSLVEIADFLEKNPDDKEVLTK